MTSMDDEPRFTRRPWRTLFGLLAALVGSYWVGRQLGLGNDELAGYLLASLSIVVAAGLVALLLFGVIRLFRR
jgi:apolipoprotein N-acyltransferase